MLSVKLYIYLFWIFFCTTAFVLCCCNWSKAFPLPSAAMSATFVSPWKLSEALTRNADQIPDMSTRHLPVPQKKTKKKNPKPPFPFTSCRLAVFPTDKKIYAYILYAYISMQWACAWDSGVGQKVAENSSSCYWLPVEYLYIFRLNRTEINRRVMEYNCKDNSSDINLCLWLLRS